MPPNADAVFHALADPTRRAIVRQLVRGEASVKDIAAEHAVSLPTVLQHLTILEAAHLASSRKVGRVRTCSLRPHGLQVATAWLNDIEAGWAKRLDRLADFLDNTEKD